MLESAILEGGLKGKALGLEKINKQIEEETDAQKKEQLFIKAENIEKELDKIENMMGISSEEVLALYESITPEDATSIVLKTFEKIPETIIEKAVLKIENLKKIGGKIMYWSSVKSPMEAAMIIASVMILTMGTQAEKTDAADFAALVMEKSNLGQSSQPERTTGTGFASIMAKRLLHEDGGQIENQDPQSILPEIPSEDVLNRLEVGGNFMENPFIELSSRPSQETPYAEQNITVNGESAEVLRQNGRETVWGNRYSIDAKDVHVGTFTIRK